MRRQCARFGCNAIAVATFTFDATARTVWLDTPFEGSARAGELCTRHARSLVPPRGWQLDDRRAPAASTPQLGRGGTVRAEGAALDPRGELRILLDAHTPLLARAFRSSGAV